MEPNGGKPGISSQGMSRRSLARYLFSPWHIVLLEISSGFEPND